MAFGANGDFVYGFWVLVEAQRQPGTPPQKLVVRGGLKALDTWSKSSFSKAFLKLEGNQQFEMISSLQLGNLEEMKD